MSKKIEALTSWKVKEFNKIPKSFKFYLIFYLALMSLAIYGLITNNLLLSILIILFGFAFFVFEKKEPRDMTFAITKEGILLHDHLHYYSSLKSFWIEYESEGLQELSFKTNQIFNPYFKIPLKRGVDPTELRKILLKYLPEKEHTSNLAYFLDRF
jgi:hypothetical protein